MTTSSDVIVIGSGPAGYSAAIRARRLGMGVTLIERDQIGGSSINGGSLMMSSLLRSTEVLSLFKRASEFGLVVKGVNFDFKKLFERSRKISAQFGSDLKTLLKESDIEVVEGSARLLGKGRVEVLRNGKSERELSAKHIIIATGSVPKALPGIEPDGKFVLSYRDALRPNSIPHSMLIVGGGSAGIEFAQFYRALGADVTVIEIQDRILPNEDEEISTLARKIMERQGIKFITGSAAKKVDRGHKNVTVTIEQGVRATLSTHECVIIAAGFMSNTENLGLENTNIKIENGSLQISPWHITDEAGVYAIGDVVGAQKLANKAIHEGILCIERIAGVMGIQPVDYTNIPRCVHGMPNIASVGLTEAQARIAGHEVKIGRSLMSNNEKAASMGEAEGMIKTVFDAKSGALLGAHIIAPYAVEMIQGYTIARTLETTERELMKTIFPHSTISESMIGAVRDAFGRGIF